jgi:hypothetical protein
MTIKQAVVVLNRTYLTVRRYIQSGQIRVMKEGSPIWVDAADIDNLAKTLRAYSQEWHGNAPRGTITMKQAMSTLNKSRSQVQRYANIGLLKLIRKGWSNKVPTLVDASDVNRLADFLSVNKNIRRLPASIPST